MEGFSEMIGGFNNERSRKALRNNPQECPFEYLRFEELNDKYVIKSKLIGDQEPLPDVIYDSVDEFKQNWDQMIIDFPNLIKCGDPYANYVEKVSQEQRESLEQNEQVEAPTTATQTQTTASTTQSSEPEVPVRSGNFQMVIGTNDPQNTFVRPASVPAPVPTPVPVPHKHQINIDINVRPVLKPVKRKDRDYVVKPVSLAPTTVPSPAVESFQGDQPIEKSLASPYENRDLPVRGTVRSEKNPSQLHRHSFADPSVPQLRRHEQIDTSVKVSNRRIGPTYTEQHVESLQREVLDSDFLRQREQQKLILGMRHEIERLTREIEQLNERVMNERRSYNELSSDMAQSQDQTTNVSNLNVELRKKIQELENRNSQLHEMFLKTDSLRNTLATQLKNTRSQLHYARDPGYSYMSPTDWTVPQKRTQICKPQTECPVCPQLSNSKMSDYKTVFDKTAIGSVLPKFKYEVLYDQKYYQPRSTIELNETAISRRPQRQSELLGNDPLGDPPTSSVKAKTYAEV
jgi:hypothetical protein